MPFGYSNVQKPFCLVVLDGWGIAPAWGGNAITEGKTQVFDKIWKHYPSTTLLAASEAVGLPANSPGNSEAGHLNIGAGRIVHQDITIIDNQIEDQSFFQNDVLLKAIEHARHNRSNIHLMGLLSKTGTHSHVRHLYALLKLLKRNDFHRVFIHLFSDGRDSDPMSGIEMVDEVQKEIAEIGIGRIISVTGRFFAMDRDNRWGRIARAYNLYVKGEGNQFPSAMAAFSKAYAIGQTDEFIEPRLIVNKDQQYELVSDNDVIVLFNFRSDRTKELTRAFLDNEIQEFPDRKKLKNLFFASFAIYEDSELPKKVFYPERIVTPLAQVWSDKKLRQYHTSETEKYPHVTYFFNGGVEKPFDGETRVMVPSPKDVKTYNYKPEMSAREVTANLTSAMGKMNNEVFVVNLANADMVGHTGDFEATVSAVECVDQCLGKILDKMISLNGTVAVMADHGNAEQMVNPRTGYADTEHTTNPVPFVVVSEDPRIKNIKLGGNGILASVAPTILELMEIKKPMEMINESLIINEGALL